MASTNKTANLELSQFIGSDKPDWLTDYNTDMLNIDNSYGEVSANAEVAARNAQIASDNAAAAISKADDAVSQISGVVDTVTRAEEVADRAEGVANDALTIANNTAALAQDAVGYANDALAKAASAKEQSESALASAATAVATANEAKGIAETAADDVAGAVDKADTAKAAADAAQAAADDVGERVDDIGSLIPSNASAANKLATAADVPSAVTVDSALSVSSENPVQNKVITAAINDENGRIDDIERLIPANASASNQLATQADIQGGGGSGLEYITIELNGFASTWGGVLANLWTQIRNHPRRAELHAAALRGACVAVYNDAPYNHILKPVQIHIYNDPSNFEYAFALAHTARLGGNYEVALNAAGGLIYAGNVDIINDSIPSGYALRIIFLIG